VLRYNGSMGVYADQVLPRIQDKVMDRKVARPIRSRVCSGLHGDVVEIGFGSGLNVAYYPAEIGGVWAVEPSLVCMGLARKRIDASSVEVAAAGLDGQDLDLPSERFDAALSTWTLCTIPDVDRALSEVRRVLKPGGSFHFVEHGRAPDRDVVRWQKRIEPFNKRFAGGCHLTRRIVELVTDAGFVVEQLD
jgi:ubiquinone/menaquinone biosynthesis C-methylase UbiE